MRENSRVHQDQFSPSFLRILYMFYSVLELSLSLSLEFFLSSIRFRSSSSFTDERKWTAIKSFPFLFLSFFSLSIFSFRLVSRLLVPRFFLSCLPCLAHSLIVRALFYSMNGSILPMTRTRTEL